MQTVSPRKELLRSTFWPASWQMGRFQIHRWMTFYQALFVSISGPWMSTSAMAQEFAGLPDNNAALGSRTAGRSVNTVNMYLPAYVTFILSCACNADPCSHHHIESVHFTTSKGEALHTAVAVVQTPGREYYVLRDNGMQVGCEEEGIAEVWQRILGCDTLGRACRVRTVRPS